MHRRGFFGRLMGLIGLGAVAAAAKPAPELPPAPAARVVAEIMECTTGDGQSITVMAYTKPDGSQGTLIFKGGVLVELA